MKRQIAQFLLVLVLSVFSVALYGQITPSDDAYINTNGSARAHNYGGGYTLAVANSGLRGGAFQTAFIAFDLSSIPAGYAGANINKATLKLYVDSVTTAGSFNVDFVNGSWTESSLTANNAPALGTTIAASVPLVTSQVADYVLIDVTPALQAWLNRSQPNDGIALVANGPLSATFDSKENSAQSHPPELDIVFASGSGTITGVTTAVGSGLQGGGTSGTLNLGLTTACGASQVLQWSGSAWVCASTGTGTITAVTAGTALTGGGTSGNVTLNLNTSQVPLLNTPNTFNGNQTVNGNLSATGLVTGAAFQIGNQLFDFGSFANGNAFLGFAGNTTMTGTNNFASGTSALSQNTSGGYNAASGNFALYNNQTGINNAAHGNNALAANTTGSDNTGVGFAAGNPADHSSLTGENNTFVGILAAPSTGALTNATAVGANAEVAESNALVLGSINGVNGATTDTKVGIGTTTPQYTLDVHGTGNFSNLLVNGQPAGSGTITGVTTAAGSGLQGGGTSGTLNLSLTTACAANQVLQWSGSAWVCGSAGTGTITGVTAGNGLLGGGTSGNVPLSVDPAKVPLLAASNTFTGSQTVNGSLSATGLVTGSAFQIGSQIFDFGSFANGNAFLGFAGNTTMTGQYNTASGVQALLANTTGVGNVASGSYALYANTSGTYNVAIGPLALSSNTTGGDNTAIGPNALGNNTTGSANTALSESALVLSTTGSYNTASGLNALSSNTTGNYNTGVGASAGLTVDLSAMTADNNTFMGANAVPSTGTLTNATAIGANAEVTKSNAMVLGSINGVNGATADTKVGIGTTAPQYTLDVHGTGNFSNLLVNGQPVGGTGTITGVTAGSGLLGGGNSGNVTLYVDTTKVVTGVSAGNGLVGGGNGGAPTLQVDPNKVPLLAASNTFTGSQIVNGNLTATGLVTGSAYQIGSTLFAFGDPSSGNALIGFSGNTTMTGGANTAAGFNALLNNTAGSSNTASGPSALASNTTGNRNTGVGAGAGQTVDRSGITADNNTFVGALASPSTGTLTNATAIGANAEVAESNALVLGSIQGVNRATANTLVGIGTTTPQYTLDVHGTGNFSNLLVNGQPVGGTGTITGVTAGTDLLGGGNSGNVTLNVDTTKVMTGVVTGTGLTGGGTGGVQTLSLDITKVPQLNTPNLFTGDQTVNGNLSATGSVNGIAYMISGVPFAYGDYSNQNAFLGFAGSLGCDPRWKCYGNTATGYQALNANTTGINNTATGRFALYNNNDGVENAAAGLNALTRDVSGSYNTGFGAGAGEFTTGEYNTSVGYESGPGYNGPRDVGNTTTLGAWATVFGQNSMAIGYAAVANEDFSTAIGDHAQVDQPNTIVLGGINGINGATADTSVGIGTTTPDAMLTVNGTADKPGGGSWGVYSDQRLKDLDGKFSAGLSQIMKINPVKYRYKEDNGMGIRDHNEHVGVVAQEIQKAIPEAVTENTKGYLLVNNDPVIWAMLNAIKEQQKEIAEQAQQIKVLRTRLKERTTRETALERRLSHLETPQRQLTSHSAAERTAKSAGGQ